MKTFKYFSSSLFLMKSYACKFCKKKKREIWTDRESARQCIKTHLDSNKDFRKKKREGSNITENMLTKEI